MLLQLGTFLSYMQQSERRTIGVIHPYQEGFPISQKFVLSNGEKDLSWIRPMSELKISLSNSDTNLNKKRWNKLEFCKLN